MARSSEGELAVTRWPKHVKSPTSRQSPFCASHRTTRASIVHRSVSHARMPLEATVICVDNSEFMRNGDVAPSRMQARSAPGVETQRARALAAVSSVFCDADEQAVSGRCCHPGFALRSLSMP